MRELIRKIAVTLTLMMILMNSSLLIIISNAVDEIQNSIDESKIEPLYEINMDKYVNYDTDGDTGTLVQINLKTGIEYKEDADYKPLSSTSIILNLPKIENEYPESVEIIGQSTKATNGSDEAKDFQYVYNNENGEIQLTVVNSEDEDGNIYSENIADARDEYTIICYYSDNCYNSENIERQLNFVGRIQANVADGNGTVRTAEIEQGYEVSENISGLISTNINATEIYNGYIYSNMQNGTSYKTEYTENFDINISKKEISDEMVINTKHNFINANNEEIETDEILYKSTKVNKNQVMYMLGENGYLQILNENGDVLGEINKDTETQEDGTYEILYNEDLTYLTIKTSEPLNVGTITLQNQKQIKESMTNIENNRINVQINVFCVNDVQKIDEDTEEIVEEQKEIYNFSDNNIIEIRNAETRVDLSVDETEWTNKIQNEVIFTATLVTDSERYSLFKNPVIEIKMPEEIEKVILGDAFLLYDSNLEINNSEVIDVDGCKVIRIEIEGTQNEYINNSIAQGANVIIPATVIAKKDIESVDTNISISYTNEISNINDYEMQGNISKQYCVSIIAMNNVSLFTTERSEEAYNGESLSEANQDALQMNVVAKVGNDILEENDVVYENEIITFTVMLKNQGTEAINNVKAVYDIPEGTVYATKNDILSDTPIEGDNGNEINELYNEQSEKQQVEIFKDTLQPGELYQETFKILVKDIDDETVISNKFVSYIDDIEKENKELNIVAKDAELSIGLYPYEVEAYGGTYSFAYYLKMESLTNYDIQDVTVQVVLSKELEYEWTIAEHNSESFDSNTGILTLNFTNLKAYESELIKIKAVAKNFEENKHNYNVQVFAQIFSNEENKYRTDMDETQVETTYFNIVQTSEKEGKKLTAGEDVEYVFEIKNEGNIGSYIEIIDNLPDGILPISAEYEIFKETSDDNWEIVNETKDISHEITIDGVVQPDFSTSTYVPAGETIKIKINAKADSLLNTIEAINVATVSGDDIFTVISNGIKNEVLCFNYREEAEDENPDDSNPDDPNPDDPNPDDPNPDDPNPDDPNPDDPNPDDPNPVRKKYSISGVVWIDENNDGKRTTDEDLYEGIVVKLFDTKTNKIVVDDENNIKKATTNENGYYSFENLEEGNYIVLFEYDYDKYSLTVYKNSSVSEKVNSDAISKEINLDGKIYTAAVTDEIKLTQNADNIDLGLVENKKFDFKLDKYVSKITVIYNNENKVYEYNDSKLAKVEIPAKQLANTTVEIEYKIVITNEGNASGYAKEIIDYLPEGLQFDSSDNNGWKRDSNNNLINTNLANKKLEPGESQEITLKLTAKNVTKQFANTAEIGNLYSVNNLKDIDSTEKNKNENEDDYSKAEVIISVKTGLVTNIIKILLIIAGLAIILLIVYKLKNKITKKSLLFVFIVMNLLTFIFGISYTNLTNVSEATNLPTFADFASISYGDLRYHIASGTTVWSIANPSTDANEYPNRIYFCVSPKHHLCTDHQHPYKKVGDEETYTSYEDFKNALNGKINNQYTFSEDFENEYKNAFQTLDTTTINIGETKSDLNEVTFKLTENNKILFGPFKVDWSYNGNIDISHSITYTGEGSVELCDSSGTSINTVSKGTPFYVLASNTIDTVKIETNLLYTTSSVKGLKAQKYVLDTSKFTYDSQGERTDNYCTSEDVNDSQTLLAVQPFEGPAQKECPVSWTVEIPKGKISLEKIDSYTKDPVSGATIKIEGLDDWNENYSETVKIGSNHTFEDLLVGRYKITEIDTPNGYSMEFQTEENTVISDIEVNQNKTTKETMENTQYSNLKILKRLVDTNEYLGTDIDRYLPNVIFNIYIIDDNGEKAYIGDNCRVDDETRVAKLDLTAYQELAKRFQTSDKGEITLYNIPTNTYYIEEIEILGEDSYYYEMAPVQSIEVYGNINDYDYYLGAVTLSLYTENGAREVTKNWNQETFVKNVYRAIVGKDLTDANNLEFFKAALGDKGSDGYWNDSRVKILINQICLHLQSLNKDRIDYISSNDFQKILYIDDILSMQLNLDVSSSIYDLYYYRLSKFSTIFVDNTYKKGSLKIIKEDYDTKEKLSGAKFNIVSNLDSSDEKYINTNVVIPESGELIVEDLIIGEYTITEIKAPNEYKLELQETTQIVTVEYDTTVKLEQKNRKYGNLIIEKMDEAKKYDESTQWSDEELHKLEDITFENVKFKIYFTKPNDSTPIYISNYKENLDKPSTFTETDEDGAEIFITDSNSKIELRNIPQYYIYHVQEVELPDELAQYYDVKSDSVEVVLENNYQGLNTILEFLNKQVRVDLEGYVWEDIQKTKTTERNDLYDDDNIDKRVSDISVYLKKNGKIIAERKTDSDGVYFFPAKGKYYSDGTGKEYTINIKELSQYVVEFEYNGLKYENVFTEKEINDPYNDDYVYEEANTSKAKEVDDDRTKLNDSFATIIGENEVENGKTEGYSVDKYGNKTNKLIYDSEEHESTLLSSEYGEYTVESMDGKVEPIGNSTGVLMTANTGEAGYTFKWYAGLKVIRNVNLGIYERTQSDLAVVTDIDNIQLTINGYSHTYEYRNRSQYINNGLPDAEINPGYDAALDGFSVGVKNNESYRTCTYTRKINDSYIAYTKENPNSENKLRVFVTYKIAVKNESGKYSKVSLRNYADTRFDRVEESYYIDRNQNKIAVSWNQTSNGIWETEKIDNYINSAECMIVYLKYELNTESVIDLARLSDNQALELNRNVTEILSYSTFSDTNNTAYAGIDKDSAPNNIIYDETGADQSAINTYEDDTDAAPNLIIKRKETKELAGFVFEDDSELNAENERRGSGKYEDGENKAENVEVKILTYNNGNEVAKLYNLDEEGNVVVTNAQNLTGTDGKYKFVGLIPGEYYVQYTYGTYDYVDVNNSDSVTENIQTMIGDTKVTTQDYKSTIIDSNKFRTIIDGEYSVIKADYEAKKNQGNAEDALWYWHTNPDNSLYSSAVDDWSLRQTINNNLSTIDYNNKNAYDTLSDDESNHYMKANTGILDFAIEEYRDQITDLSYEEQSHNYEIAFGIVERPRQRIELYKEVSHLKLKLANGQILAEGDPRDETIEYVTYPEGGRLKIEVDSEIIEGATLEVTFEMKVKNNSELDYNSRDYYVYGIRGTTPVATNIEAIIDYMDENLKTEYTYSSDDSSEGVWHIVSEKKNTSLDGIGMEQNAYNTVKNKYNILIMNNPKLKGDSSTLLPGEEATIEVSASKLLSTSEEMVYKNKAELFRVSNEVGRFYGQEYESEGVTKWKIISPGNYNIANNPIEVDEANRGDSNNANIEGRFAEVIVIPPTGAKEIITYAIIALGCLSVLLGGIVIIKKKVLD